MLLQEMRQKKRELGYSNEMIARLSGIPKGTVDKVLSGRTRYPRRETMLALERVLLQQSPRQSRDCGDSAGDVFMVREAAPAYNAQPARKKDGYTYEDYLALPEDRRAELIDGVFYDMASPAAVHQLILGRLYYILLPCVDRHPDCELYLSPSDVRLGSDNRTVVQPDLYIRCGSEMSRTDESGTTTWLAPDFVAEILSPSSRAHDMIRKLNKYLDAGVREYWIIDPKEQRVIVYNFEKEEYLKSYTFDDTVPVGIFGGECEVDFSYIREKVRKHLG